MTKGIGIIESGVNAAGRLWQRPLWLVAGGGGLVFLLGVVFLAGWMLRTPGLVHGQPGVDTIPPSGALGFLLSGAGLAAVALERRRWAALCGGGAALVGGANIAGHLLGNPILLDGLFFRLFSEAELSALGGMPPGGAVSFLLAGAGILSAASPLPRRWHFLVYATTGTAVAFTGILARTGFIGQAGGPGDVSFVPGLPALAALNFLLLGVGLIVLGIYGNEGPPSREEPASAPGLRSLASISPTDLLLPLLGAGLLLGSLGIFIVGLQQSRQSQGAVRHTLDVIIALGLVESAALSMQTEERGFVITGKEELLTSYQQVSKGMDEALSRAKRLTFANPELQGLLEKVRSLRGQWGAWAESVIAVRRSAGGAQKAQELVIGGRGRELMIRLQKELDLAQNVELRLLAERKTRESASQTLLTIALLFCVMGGILVGMTQFWLARRLVSQHQILVSEIAARKEGEENLKRANSAYEAVNKELAAFAYSVAHDLRQPLRGMTGFSQILLEDFGPRLPRQAQDYLERIQRASARMGQLIDDMLTLSRISRDEMRRGPVNLGALAAEVLDELRKAEPGRQVECAIAEGLEVSGDARLLRILLDNLLGNSWKFTGRVAKPKIEFGAIPSDGGRAFMIRDNGAGFDMAYADKLFGAFQRLHDNHDFPGTGIGLAIAQRIVNRHGGRIWAEASIGQGAIFYFTV